MCAGGGSVHSDEARVWCAGHFELQCGLGGPDYGLGVALEGHGEAGAPGGRAVSGTLSVPGVLSTVCC